MYATLLTSDLPHIVCKLHYVDYPDFGVYMSSRTCTQPISAGIWTHTAFIIVVAIYQHKRSVVYQWTDHSHIQHCQGYVVWGMQARQVGSSYQHKVNWLTRRRLHLQLSPWQPLQHRFFTLVIACNIAFSYNLKTAGAPVIKNILEVCWWQYTLSYLTTDGMLFRRFVHVSCPQVVISTNNQPFVPTDV